MNLADLTKLLAFVAAAFAVLRAALGKPLLSKIVNPNQGVWLWAVAGMLLAVTGILRWEAKSNDPGSMLAVLKPLVNDDKPSAAVLVAGFTILTAAVIFGMVVYCWLRLPRDPAAYSKPQHRAKAIRYYTRLAGGLDYAILIKVDKTDGGRAEVIAEAELERQIHARLGELRPKRTVEEQTAAWQQLALDLHRRMPEFDKLAAVGRQGNGRRVMLDVQYGGFIIEYLHPPEIGDDTTFLFGATLFQHEVDSRRFEDHFDLLAQALRNIDAHVKN